MSRRLLVALLSVFVALVVAAPAGAKPIGAGAAACQQQVTFALTDARTTGCFTQTGTNPDTWTSTDPVTLNGIPMQALPGTQLLLTGPTTASPGGKVGVTTKITILGVTIFNGGFNYNLPAGNPGDLKQLAMFSAPSGLKIKGFSVGGSITLQMGKDATGAQQGYTRFQLVLQLPDIFKNGPNQGAGGLTGTVAIRADAAGVHADTLKIEVANAYVGQLLLKNVCLSYVSSTSPTPPCSAPNFGAKPLLECGSNPNTNRWDGSALITLPTASKPDVGLFAGTSDGQFAYAGAQVTNLGNSVPLATGVYLDKIGIGLCLKPPPLKIKGSATIRFGPDFKGKQAASLDGTIEYIDSRPWVINLSGRMSLFDKQVASGHFTYRSDNSVDFGFNVAWNFFGVLDLSGGVQGWYQPARTVQVPNISITYAKPFNIPVPKPAPGTHPVSYPTAFDVYGNARVCVVKIVCVGGEAAVSSVGVAGCASITVFGYPEPYWFGVRWKKVQVSAGAGYRWGGGGVNVMATSCSVGGYRASKSAVIAASGATSIQLQHVPGVSLAIHGLTGAPDVQITGPGGKTIVLRGSGQLARNSYFAVLNPDDKTTSITLAQPAAGTWTITPLPGSSPITTVDQAPVDPPPGVGGEVAGSGVDRQLKYVVEHQPGDTVTFYERGTGYEGLIGVAAGEPCLKDAPIQGERPADSFMARPNLTCGALSFSPAPGPAGTRDIIAVVSNNGEPVGEFPVTSYTASAETLPPAPTGLTVTRNGTNVTITWNASPGAYDYNVDVNLTDGTKVVDVPGKADRNATLTNIPTDVGVNVSVAGIRFDDVTGPASTASSAATTSPPVATS